MTADRIRIALAGIGHWGPNLAHSIVTAGAELGWLCDRDVDRLRKFAQHYPNARTTANFAAMLADPSVDAVIIATPTSTHHPLARAALHAGKHVFVEKPLALTSGDARELVELAEAKQRTLLVGHVFQYNATIRALKYFIDRGELGDLMYMTFTRTNLGPVRTDANALWDLATHDISIMTYLINELPEAVTASGYSYLNPGVEDVVFAAFNFASGVVAHVHASWLNPRKVRNITVIGDKKMAEVDDLDMRMPIRLFDRRVEAADPHTLVGSYVEFKTTVVDGGITVPRIEINRPLETECVHFLECIRTGQRPISDGINGLEVVCILEAANRSLQQNSTRIHIK
jgi:predicted dehydrogenase